MLAELKKSLKIFINSIRTKVYSENLLFISQGLLIHIIGQVVQIALNKLFEQRFPNEQNAKFLKI